MKKTYKFLVVAILLFLLSTPSFSQKLTVGVLNGINFTRPQGELRTGKWATKNGPVTGLFVNYKVSKILSVQTEFDYTVVNYSHKNYSNYGYHYEDIYLLSSSIAPSYYYNNGIEKWEFSFYRIPLYIKLSTPTKLKLELAFGGYVSFRNKFELPTYPSNKYFSLSSSSSLWAPNYYTNEPPKHDAGYFYSVGLSYPLTEKFTVNLNGRYFSGRRTYIESVAARNGVAELTFGIGYSGILKDKNKIAKLKLANDSTRHPFSVKVKTGFAFTQNSGNFEKKVYSGSTGLSSGLSFMYSLSRHFAIQTELLIERKGYQFTGESNSFFRYTPGNTYTVDNKISLGYVTIPLLLKVRFGEKLKVYFNGGMYAAMLTNARCTGIAYSLYKSDVSYNYSKTTVYDNITAHIKSNDWGWSFGSGIQYPVCNKYNLDFEFRYNTGNSNIYSNKSNYSPFEGEDTKIKNKSYAFTLGLQIPIN